MAWIELHQDLVEHKKMKRLLQETGAERATAIGRLCMLWLWTLNHRPDGDVSDLEAADFGKILELGPRKAAAFREALVRSGFLDREGESMRVHDWEDYAGRLLELRRRNVERAQRNRLRKKQMGEADDVSRNECETNANVSGLPYQTQPNPTQPNQTSFSGDDERAGADASEMAMYLEERGLLAESWFGATPELLARSRVLTELLFQSFCDRRPTEADYARVFPLVTQRERGEDGQTLRYWDADRADLLRYAFEQAALNSAAGKWNYVDGVLQRLHQRGIRTRAQAEDYELRRDGLIE